MAMANAVEARFPFLDPRIFALAARLPPRLKVRGLQAKRILRLAARELLPPVIARRVKQPYRAPGSRSFAGDHPPAYIAECLAPSEIVRTGYFDPAAVARLIARTSGQNVSRFGDSRVFVSILSTQLWNARFCRATATA
jgi:asparagine synthase (glutamine-hydrolysing)